VVAVDRLVSDLVSILARRTRRAQHFGSGQSATTITFQSSPAARGGRNHQFLWNQFPSGGVSILARRTRRAQRTTCRTPASPAGFNPRPPHAAGATS